MAAKRGFGTLRQLPSGRWQATYLGPDGRRRKATDTFRLKTAATAFLDKTRTEISGGTWIDPEVIEVKKTAATFGTYSAAWLDGRDLKPRTRSHYRMLLETTLLPTFADREIPSITAADVRVWHARQGTDTPTLRSHAYGLLRTILATAVADGIILGNPCHIRGAGAARKVHKTEPATLAQLTEITAVMPERYRALVSVTAWCALRFGEATELRRGDIDLTGGVIRIRRGVVRVDGEVIVGTPKTDAGTRDVAIPPHLVPVLAAHLLEHAGPGANGLVFPAADRRSQLAPSTLYRVYYPAREAAGRPDLRWHDLRHTGAVLAAQTGATLAELMGRLGHSTPAAAMRYQHAAAGRDQILAAKLSALATAAD